MSSPFNPSTINEEIRCHFWAIKPDQEGLYQFGGITQGVDYHGDVTTVPNTTLAHEPSGIVRTPGSGSPIGHIDLDHTKVGVNDLQDAVKQPVHKLGNKLQGCTPDPLANAGEGKNVHDTDGFIKPCLPTQSITLLVQTSASDESPRNKEGVPTPKDLRNALPQWYRMSTARPEEGTHYDKKFSQPASIENFFEEEPSTVFMNNSDQTKACKCKKKCHYRAKLNKLKYQQLFLKEDPLFTYHGEIQVRLFKKWCYELHDWAKHACLDWKKSIHLAGKYLDG
ncbi:hypothetical protein V8B97DRAFT_2023186 [Scleroderma yunnanense]